MKLQTSLFDKKAFALEKRKSPRFISHPRQIMKYFILDFFFDF